MPDTADHTVCWSLKLLDLLQEMAVQKTSAALELLADVDHPEPGHPYPETGLLFANRRWRAFYHCHETNPAHAGEHGHFHIFTDTGNRAWAHVAGLSIDAEGQPLQWFAVNRWVTDGPWLERDRFLSQLKIAATDTGKDSLTGRWLLALLQLYRDALSTLLTRRDVQIQRRLQGRSKTEALEDHAIYTLATQAIELQPMLETNLLVRNTGTAATVLNK